MAKFVCTVCGYTAENEAPEACPVCKAAKAAFKALDENNKNYADEHRIGVAKDVDSQILEGLRANFMGECTEVGMYLAMSRQADREGYPEIAEAFKRYAFEEADHASRFAELLGEVGMYLAMSRQADREGYPEIAEAFKRYAFEEADHASRFAELLGEVVTSSTKRNLELRAEAEFGACDGKMMIAKRAKELGLDAIHDTVHEMAKDEARHGRGFDGLLARYFG